MLSAELKDCAEASASLDRRMGKIKDTIEDHMEEEHS